MELRKRTNDQTPVLMITCQYDPEDEMMVPFREFMDMHETELGRAKPEHMIAKGHNHISPPMVST